MEERERTKRKNENSVIEKNHNKRKKGRHANGCETRVADLVY